MQRGFQFLLFHQTDIVSSLVLCFLINKMKDRDQPANSSSILEWFHWADYIGNKHDQQRLYSLTFLSNCDLLASYFYMM